jgi:hypothetical protein
MKEISCILIRLVQAFDSVTSKDPNDWVEGSALALMSNSGTKSICKARLYM